MKKPEENSLTNKILNYLESKSQDLFDLTAKIIFNPYAMTRGMAPYKGHSRYSTYNKNISNLKSSSYFILKDGNFYLSSKGRIEIIKNIIKKKKKVKKWDEKWRAIIFDVPEKKRHERNFLRRELKLMGFKELQHSIWITPYDIEKELLCLLKLWHKDFRGDIRFLRIEKIIDDKDFRNIFNLQ